MSVEGDGLPSLATTDSEGIFSFTLSDPSREIRFRVEANGFEPFDLRIIPSKHPGTQAVPLSPWPTPPRSYPVTCLTAKISRCKVQLCLKSRL